MKDRAPGEWAGCLAEGDKMSVVGKRILRLTSGFTFDYTNMVGEGRITGGAVEALRPGLQAAHAAVERLRRDGYACGHMSKDGKPEKVLFTKLPYVEAGGINTPETLGRLKEFGESLRYQVDAVVSLGVGGSYLGNKVLFDVHCGEFWNLRPVEDRNGYPKYFFGGNNLDPRRILETAECLLAEARCKARAGAGRYKVMLLVISKSGTTIDTMAAFLTLREALLRHPGLVEVAVAAVTDLAEGPDETLLHRLAREEGWPIFSVPDGVGGRFSVFSEAGLITAACIGFDAEKFLAGARAMDEACRTADVGANPALLNAALKYLAAAEHGRDIEVFMPYGDYLKSVAEWYIQLLSESLGKRRDREGREVFYGRTPVAAVGTTDMHAQTQLHQDGKRDKVVQFVKVAGWEPDALIPNSFPRTRLAECAGVPLSRALEAALEANAEALSRDNRFNAVLVLPKLNAFHLGELCYFLALSVAYEGELANVNAYDQPGVEAYKAIMLRRLKDYRQT